MSRIHQYAPHAGHGIPCIDPEPLDAEPDPEDLAEFEDTLRRQRAEDGDSALHLGRGGVY